MRSRGRLLVAVVCLATAGASVGVAASATGTASMTATTTSTSTVATPVPSSVKASLRLIASGFGRLTGVTSARDGSGRLFVVEQDGDVRVVKGGVVQSAAYLDIADRLTNEESELGLLSIAFHPDFVHHPYVYAAYTRVSDGALTVSRFTAKSASAATVSASTERVVLVVPHPNYGHYGGQLLFDRHGYLLLTTGDGGCCGDPYGNPENLKSPLGKVLRINVDLTCSPRNYCNVGSNPYYNDPDALHDIFESGLRNPWSASIDRADGSLWIADVGEDEYEEINHVADTGGNDFGWSCKEAAFVFNTARCAGRHMTDPVGYYGHGKNDSNGCAVIGGYVYHGPSYPFAHGLYLFGDFCSQRLLAIGRTSRGGYPMAVIGHVPSYCFLTAFGEGDRGEVYAVDHSGHLYHLVLAKA